jgi:hypothetical protein
LELGKRTGLEGATIAKVLDCKESVDCRTLERFFKAFNLELDASDYTKPDSENVEHKKEMVSHRRFKDLQLIEPFSAKTEERSLL